MTLIQATEDDIARLGAGWSPFKRACRVVSVGESSFSGLTARDGVTLTAGDRVLVPTGTRAGVYNAMNGTWLRAADLSHNSFALLGMFVVVLEGAAYGGSTWRLASPTTGAISLGVTELTFEQYIQPDGTVGRDLIQTDDTTGDQDTAAIMAAQAVGDVYLKPGATFFWSERGALSASGGRILGQGATLKRGSSFASGGADVVTNSVIRVIGAASGSISTTLSTTAKMGSGSIVVVDATDIVAGMWLRLEGTNVADLFYGQSDAEVIIELVKVASVSGNTVTLVSRTLQHHALGKPVTSFSPFVGDPTRPLIQDLYLDWSGSGTTAVGIEIDGAVNVRFDNIAGRGFTRSLFVTTASKNTILPDATSRGDNNGLAQFYTSQLAPVDNPMATGENGRQHDSGIPRPMILVDDMSVGVAVQNAHMTKIPAFWRRWGGIACGVQTAKLFDVDCTEVVSRDAAMLVSNPAGIMGSIYDGGIADLAGAAFAYLCYFNDVTALDVTQPSAADQWAVYAHDGFLETMANFTVGNKGGSPGSAGSYLCGVYVSDSDGIMTNTQIHGCLYAFGTKNFLDRWQVTDLFINGSPGAGASGAVGLYINHEGGAGTGPIFRNVVIGNVSNPAYFTAGHALSPDPELSIEDATFNIGSVAFRGSALRATKFSTGAVGTVLRVTGGSPEAAPEAVGPHHGNAISAETPTNGWGFAAYGNALAKHTGTAAVRGDLLVADALGNLVVNNTPKVAGIVYRALRASGGGYVEVQRVGMVFADFDAITVNTVTGGAPLTVTASGHMFLISNGILKLLGGAGNYAQVQGPTGVFLDGAAVYARSNDGNTTFFSAVEATQKVTVGKAGSTVALRFNGPTQSTVGAVGGASALPATPLGYRVDDVNGVEVAIPYYSKT